MIGKKKPVWVGIPLHVLVIYWVMFQLRKSGREFDKISPIFFGEFGEIVTVYISFVFNLFDKDCTRKNSQFRRRNLVFVLYTCITFIPPYLYVCEIRVQI